MTKIACDTCGKEITKGGLVTVLIEVRDPRCPERILEKRLELCLSCGRSFEKKEFNMPEAK